MEGAFSERWPVMLAEVANMAAEDMHKYINDAELGLRRKLGAGNDLAAVAPQVFVLRYAKFLLSELHEEDFAVTFPRRESQLQHLLKIVATIDSPTLDEAGVAALLRFGVGERVEATLRGGWIKGTVQALRIRPQTGRGVPSPYQVMLDSGETVLPPLDDDCCVRRAPPGSVGAGGAGGAASTALGTSQLRSYPFDGRLAGAAMANFLAPLLPAGARDPLRSTSGTCDWCRKPVSYAASFSCAKCHAVTYCSAACQRAHWKGGGEGDTEKRPRHKDGCVSRAMRVEQVQKESELAPAPDSALAAAALDATGDRVGAAVFLLGRVAELVERGLFGLGDDAAACSCFNLLFGSHASPAAARALEAALPGGGDESKLAAARAAAATAEEEAAAAAAPTFESCDAMLPLMLGSMGGCGVQRFAGTRALGAPKHPSNAHLLTHVHAQLRLPHAHPTGATQAPHRNVPRFLGLLHDLLTPPIMYVRSLARTSTFAPSTCSPTPPAFVSHSLLYLIANQVLGGVQRRHAGGGAARAARGAAHAGEGDVARVRAAGGGGRRGRRGGRGQRQRQRRVRARVAERVFPAHELADGLPRRRGGVARAARHVAAEGRRGDYPARARQTEEEGRQEEEPEVSR
jgi:hypothetical protein